MSYGFITQFLRFSGLLAIGLVSLVFLLAGNSENKIYLGKGEISFSKYGIGFLDKEDNFSLLAYPLNDFYYKGQSGFPLLGKVDKSGKDEISELWLYITDFLLNRQHVLQTFEGPNGKVNYQVSAENGQIELTRKIELKNAFEAVGETINLCSSCFVVDEKHRMYFNSQYITQDMVDFAKDNGYTPYFVGSDQFFPKEVKKVSILNKEGKNKIELPVFPYNQVFLRDKSHLELKTYIKEAKKVNIKQVLSTL